MKILPLKGYKALRALNAFSALLLGLKMLPAYITLPFDEFYASFNDMTAAEKEKMLREAVMFVELSQDEVMAMVSFASDANDVQYGPENFKNLGPFDIHEIIVAVAMEIGRIEVGIVTEAEKKN